MDPYLFYFGGALFTHKDLAGNAALAEAVHAASGGRYVAKLPQVLEQRETTAHAIRDQDLLTLVSCDLALFNYDGTELDSGTVVEFLFAKFADIPSVILRTDYRSWGADQANFPWNLMTSYFPRTEVRVIDAMTAYQQAIKPFKARSEVEIVTAGYAREAAAAAITALGAEVSRAFDAALAEPPRLPADDAKAVFEWLARLAGFQNEARAQTVIRAALSRKRSRQLL